MARRALACVALLLSAAGAALPARQDVDPNVVRARLLDYLVGYETELSTLVAEERLQQWPLRGAGATTGAVLSGRRDLTRIRSLVSDVAFVSLPGNVGWLGYRDVVQIGGRPVRPVGPSLVDLLTSARIVPQHGRWSVGPSPRLDPQAR